MIYIYTERMRIEIGKRDSRYINAHICYFSFKNSKKEKKNSNDENKNKNRIEKIIDI